jgi:CubicO group peptidase (beta-lactamase class C family)
MDPEEDKTFYTATMAQVYVDQGRYAAAARIYRYLLERTPDRADWQQALAAVLANMSAGTPQWEAVRPLVERWIRLMLRYNALRRLERISFPPPAADL